jgi:hypothetical protein
MKRFSMILLSNESNAYLTSVKSTNSVKICGKLHSTASELLYSVKYEANVRLKFQKLNKTCVKFILKYYN